MVGHVRGIEIGLHSSWLVLAALLVSSLAGHYSTSAPEWGTKLIWATAAVTALAVFASLIAHELAHAAVAQSRGIPVNAITLFALGGVARIDAEAEDPRTEFWMGLAGPLASAAIGLLAWYGVVLIAPGQAQPDPIVELLALVAASNLAIAAFNLIPGFPLDGGRVLRAALWGYSGDPVRATRLAARSGQAVGGGFIILGAARVVGGAGIGGLWLAFIGWFLLEAATAAHAQAELRRLLGNVPVSSLMTEPATVEAAEPLGGFIETRLLPDGGACFVVTQDRVAVGLITATDASKVPKLRWGSATVRDAMRPIAPQERLELDTSAADALERMAKGAVLHLPVVDFAGIRGMISRTKLLEALETRRLL